MMRAFGAVFSKRLTKRGFEVTLAYSGTEAIQTLRAQEFDVAILDLKMEDMDGIEVLKIFIKMAPDMPVVMLPATVRNSLLVKASPAVRLITSPNPTNWKRDLLEKLNETFVSRKGHTS